MREGPPRLGDLAGWPDLPQLLPRRQAAPVVADLLGIHVHTALRWAGYTAPDWASYLNARTITPDPLPEPVRLR